MVTKLSDTVVETAVEKQFRNIAGENSGLNFEIAAGKVMEVAGLVEIPQQTLALTDDTTNYVYLSFDAATVALGSGTTLPTLGHLLFTVVTASAAISSIVDHRWRAMEGRLQPLGSFNELDDFLDVNSWAYYPMRESATGHADSQSNGPTLTERSANGTAYGLPGLTRGSPIHGAIHTLGGSANNRTLTASGGIAADNWTEGGISAIIHMHHLSGGSTANVIMQQTWTDTTADDAEFAVLDNGELRFRVDFGSHFILVRSATGTILEGVTYVVMVMQNNDGNGPLLYVDGVDVTNSVSYGGSMTGPDEWVSDAAAFDSSTVTPSLLSLGTNVSNDAGRFIVCCPAIHNAGLSAAQVLEHYNAANLTGDPSDTYEFLFEQFLGSNGDVGWFPARKNGGALQEGFLGGGTGEMQGSWIGTVYSQETTQLNTGYAGAMKTNWSTASGSNPAMRNTAVTKNTEMGPQTTNLTGTVCVICTPESDTVSDLEQNIWGIGHGGTVSFASATTGGFSIHAIGDGSGNVSFHLVSHTKTTGTNWRIGAVGAYPIDTQYRIVIVQDGTSMTAYVNGTEETLNVTATKNSTDWSTEWVGDVVTAIAATTYPWYIGSAWILSGNTQDFEGDVHFVGITANGVEWGTTEVNELEDAIAGNGLYA